MGVLDEWDLSGKSAIVTADRRGWTPYLAGALAEAGADVVVAGPPNSDATQAVEAITAKGQTALLIETDLTDRQSINDMVDRAASELGKIDVLVNNARVDFAKPFLEVTEEEWDAVADGTVKSMFMCCQAAGRHMLDQGGGRIINISSGLAERGLWNSTVASATQGAVRQLTASLGLELARLNVRVNAIGAGWVTTEPQPDDASRELLSRYIPSRRKGHPNDLAGLLVYLASDSSDFVTGQTVYVDGGATAHA